MALSKLIKYSLLVIAMIAYEKVEARRTILKGRKTITRTYYRESTLPAWVTVVLVGLGEIFVGAVAFFIMKKLILDPPVTGSYSPVPIRP